MKNTKFLVLITVLMVIGLGCAYLVLYLSPAPQVVSAEEVVIITDKSEYVPGEPLKIKIENRKKEKICFSSCYPYYFQRKNSVWDDYVYEECDKKDVVESCVDSNDVKAFELTLPELRNGIHRLLLSACVGCEAQQAFEKEENLFSNRFIIN